MMRKWKAHLFPLLDAIEALTGVSPDRIRNDSKHRLVSRARGIAWTAMHMRGIGYSEISRITGGYHHTTVMAGVDRCADVDMASRLALNLDLWTVKDQRSMDDETNRREDLFAAHCKRWREMCRDDIKRAVAR